MVWLNTLKERAQMRSKIEIYGLMIWSWTLGGLPSRLFLPGFLRHWSETLYVEHLPIKASGFSKGGVFDLLLGPDLLLEKRLILPIVARSNLSKAIDLNMRQSLPGGGDDLLWCCGTGKRNGSTLDIPVYLLKKSVLAEIMSVASLQKAKVRSARVAWDASARPFWDGRKHVDYPLRFWGIIEVALVIAFIGVLAWRELNETRSLQHHVTHLEEKKTTLSNKAIALRAKIEAENTNFATISRDLKIFEAEYYRLPILLSLTETLSDETWISELAISSSSLHLSGFTGRDVTDVMTSLRELPWVKRVDLDGPVSFDSFSHRNRFDFSITLNSALRDHP